MKDKKTMMIAIITGIVAAIFIAIFAIVGFNQIGGSAEGAKYMDAFNKAFNSKKRTVIYYASSECGYCELETPILETIADDYDMEYTYIDSIKLSDSQRKSVLDKLQIEHATPTTVIVENGKVIDTQVGYAAGQEYVKFFIDSGMLPKDAVYSKEKDITFINYTEYEELLKGGTHVVVVGQTTCSHCIAIKPALNSIAGDYKLTINYLNITDFTEDEQTKFSESLKNIGYNDPDFLADGSYGTPLTLIIENGKVKGYISGERTTSQLEKEFKSYGLI